MLCPNISNWNTAPIVLLVLVCACRGWAGTADGQVPVDFDREVRPILADLCFGCHGPDAQAREADLRLDIQEGLFSKTEAGALVVPGNAEQSELLRRVVADDESLQMPPPKFGRRLNAQQIQTLRRWIDGGAQWQAHWAFRRIERPPLPNSANQSWSTNPIDHFLSATHQREKLQPTEPATRTTLARRLSFDLLGVPPSIDDVQALVQDDDPNALNEFIDRLLVSPKFGERLAIDWLDGARYADTSGYQNDGPRHMWRWRDWVIDALNQNMPFDQFTVEQVAGDLIPGATVEQRLATGFQRNHRGNAEGGIVPEEFAVEYVVDRVETTSAVWLGLTLGCARCHDHKYDPISQKEFYQLFAFFNNIPETGRAIKEGNSPPYLQAPTAEQSRELRILQAQLESAHEIWKQKQIELDAQQAKWVEQLKNELALGKSRSSFSTQTFEQDQGITLAAGLHWRPQIGVSLFLDGTQDVFGSQADVDSSNSQLTTCEGPINQAISFDGAEVVEAGDFGKFGYFDKFSLCAWINPQRASGTILSRMPDVAQADGYYLVLDQGHLQLNLVKRWLDDSLRVQTLSTVPLGSWTHVVATYDGSRRASGVRIYINGVLQTNQVNLDQINQSFASSQPLRIGSGNGPENRFLGAIDEVGVYERVLDPDEISALSVPQSIAAIAAKENPQPAERHKLNAYFRDSVAATELRQAFLRWWNLREQWTRYVEQLPTAMVMQERDVLRPAFILSRGEYDQPREAVAANVPGCLPNLPADAPRNRLGLAQWLVHRDQPLTARVIVNRYWQMLFGVGLVKTSEDFGLQGERPAHPELLDWLAVDFMESGWDLKRLLRLIVTSAAYQQSSSAARDAWAQDPENRFIARGPRFRLPAESIRDAALTSSGLMASLIGGPSAKPYQPDGLWTEIATDTEYVRARGADLYRRSLYIYWKRTVAPPAMQTFDAPSRETCVVRRAVTNTPLQALLMMNEEGFQEAARVLAERSIREVPTNNIAGRLNHIFQLVLSRQPDEAETAMLVKCWNDFVQRYRSDPMAAANMLTVGDSRATASIGTAEIAAYTVVASLVLNLDEALTKE